MVSIVIPAYNEEQYIRACLTSLAAQTTKQPFEIIVVDNGSTDTTASIVKEFLAVLPLRLITERRKGRGVARHAGYMQARGDIILSTDADGIVPPHWIEAMCEPFATPNVIGTTGTCYINDRSWLANKIFNVIQPTAMWLHRAMFGSFWVLGSNGAVRKTAYVKSGGFNTVLNSQEDTQLSLTLRRYGKIVCVARSRVLTSGRRFKRGMFAGLFEYVRSFLERFVFRRKNVFLRDAR